MKLKLTVVNRLHLLSLLPAEANFLTIKMIRQVKEEASFSEHEHRLLKFVNHSNGTVEWDAKSAELCTKEVDVPQPVMDLLKNLLDQLDKSNKLAERHIPFYELIVLGQSSPMSVVPVGDVVEGAKKEK